MSIDTRRRYAVTLASFALTSFHALPTGPATVGEVIGSVVTTSAMRAARAAHTATTLRDGRVLVAGGFTGQDNAVSGAELYDPRSARFVALPRMSTLRHSHTATLLPNATVLITGGYTAGSAVTNAAELFDPATNRFTPTGSLGAARSGHVAVALANGKVLIAGGAAQAETFNPRTRTFALMSGNSPMAGQFSAVAPIAGGGALITGGYGGGTGPRTAAWVYRP